MNSFIHCSDAEQFTVSAACICVNATDPMSINVMYKSSVVC